jgi:hypothetical protein
MRSSAQLASSSVGIIVRKTSAAPTDLVQWYMIQFWRLASSTEAPAIAIYTNSRLEIATVGTKEGIAFIADSDALPWATKTPKRIAG